MLNLTIDVGNSLIKTIIFDDTIPVFREVSKALKPSHIDKILKHFQIDRCMLSSVVDDDKALMKRLNKIADFERLSPKTSIPIKNLYETPQTLGNDRLANVIAGSFLFPEKNVLIVDVGTCIKYDFINSRRQYLGGSISPGLEMRFKAMHQFTGKLPLIKKMEASELTGDSTVTAMQSGVVFGMKEEIKGITGLYQKKYKSLKIILTGGDALRFVGQLNLSIFAAADLVNIGLNEIIRFNASKGFRK